MASKENGFKERFDEAGKLYEAADIAAKHAHNETAGYLRELADELISSVAACDKCSQPFADEPIAADEHCCPKCKASAKFMAGVSR